MRGLTHSRYFLFGLVRIPMYEWYWGYTQAQIELASADAPFVAYEAKPKPKPGEPGFKSDPEKMKRDYERWKARQSKRKIKPEDFIGGERKKVTEK